MDVRRLPADEAALRRYVEELWIPFNRELEGVIEDFSLAEEVDVVEEELDYLLDRLDSEDFRGWVAVDGGSGEAGLADTDGEFVGFVTTDVDEASAVFDRPDRVVICDIYVADTHRGTGLARELVDCARAHASEAGCPQLRLEVDVGNDRARAFYGKLGFEPIRHTMVADASGG